MKSYRCQDVKASPPFSSNTYSFSNERFNLYLYGLHPAVHSVLSKTTNLHHKRARCCSATDQRPGRWVNFDSFPWYSMFHIIYTEIFQAHNNPAAELPSPATNGCPACIFRAYRRQCYVCRAEIHGEPCKTESQPGTTGEWFPLREVLILIFHFSTYTHYTEWWIISQQRYCSRMIYRLTYVYLRTYWVWLVYI